MIMEKHLFRFSKISAKFILVITLITFLTLPTFTFASTIFETTGWITGVEGVTFDFLADQSPYTYQATLSDLSEEPFFGFDSLFLSITTATDLIDSIIGPGSFIFAAIPGETYFANVFGTGGGTGVGTVVGTVGAGLFGVQITTVPIPSAIFLLGAGLFGLVGLRKKLMR
jgi:hypothetical protein